jgi:hypothetical protein
MSLYEKYFKFKPDEPSNFLYYSLSDIVNTLGFDIAFGSHRSNIFLRVYTIIMHWLLLGLL